MSRITPAKPPYSEALQQRFARVVPKGFKPPRIYRIVARNESLFCELVDKELLGLTGLFDRGVLPARLREILILRTCVAAGNDYEWRLHVDSGLSVQMGLDATDIAATHAETPDRGPWSLPERLAMELADSLVRQLGVDDSLFESLGDHYDEPTLIEMTQLIGWYTSVAMQVALASLRPEPVK
jgi:alkylhydroperoxidase family enzyme